MITKKKFQKEHLSIILITVLLIVSVIINLSSAYFTDTASVTSSSSLTFGTIAVKASEKNSSGAATYTITANEVALKAPLYKLIKIENQTGVVTQDFYLRVQLTSSSNLVSFYIAGHSLCEDNTYYGSDYSAAADFDTANWTTDNTTGFKYYNSSISLPNNDSAKYIPVVITFAEALGSENYPNNLNVQFTVNVIQSANNGYNGWADAPNAWRTAVSS